MAPIITTIKVDRAPAEVFDYVTDPTLFIEWQRNVVGGHMDTARPATASATTAELRQSKQNSLPSGSVITTKPALIGGAGS